MKLTRLFASALAFASMTGAAGLARAAEIEFWYGNTGVVEQAILESCAAFNAGQTRDKVNCIGQGNYEVAMQKAIAAYRAKKSPVLMQFFDAGTVDLMMSGAVEPVSTVLPAVNWKDYLGGARSFYETAKGELLSQPYNGSTLILYGNRDMLSKAGIDRLPTTYEALIEDARKLKAAGIACPFVTDGHPWRVLEQFAARHGVAIASRHNGYDGLDAVYTFNKGPVATHLQNLKTWRDEGLIRLGQDSKAGKYDAAYNTGECAMMEGSTGGYGAAYKALGDKVMIALAPIYEGKSRHNTLIGGASIWIMKGHSAAEIDAAKAFLDFLRRDDQQIEFAGKTGYLPMTGTALAALKASGKASDPHYATAEIGVASLDQPATEDSRGVRLGFYVQFRDIFMKETQKAFNGEKPMQQALDDAAQQGNELLRRFEKTYSGVAMQ
ncbi:extracellular solute-binding protein [Rhizobium sp. SSA_523]|uniref:extracellular solute-binding protein n=1 Tax=Rhizobium sp. SSA_523 TaxID=2952477 RepID=UPI00209018F4|nr:extracellular solute-binding protein [Rhizobium sp. SSA_523]MCO5733237.1 extracellular solute-binding protein [Rhizobium sp. SSA_523]WKC21777.1 extracellular solute-binding protein [Rhizobium sp. SSA_523]